MCMSNVVVFLIFGHIEDMCVYRIINNYNPFLYFSALELSTSLPDKLTRETTYYSCAGNKRIEVMG